MGFLVVLHFGDWLAVWWPSLVFKGCLNHELSKGLKSTFFNIREMFFKVNLLSILYHCTGIRTAHHKIAQGLQILHPVCIKSNSTTDQITKWLQLSNLKLIGIIVHM